MTEFKKFLKNFRVLIIFTAIFVVAFFADRAYVVNRIEEREAAYYESPNTERVYGDQRVFDYADKLTDSQEAELTQYIHEAEKKTLTDIVIVTLNESLANYAPEYKAGYKESIGPDKYVMVYADKFWEDNRFGYNCPQKLDGKTDTGDGVLLVDNLFREPETGKIYTWMCTTGSVEERFSSDMLNNVLDDFYRHVEEDYFKACMDFVDSYVLNMIDGPLEPSSLWGHYICYAIGLLIILIYYMNNRKPEEGNITVSRDTYLIGKEPDFPIKEDILIDKQVTSTYCPPSSYSSGSSRGGGGHHISGGGGSHGGGGHSR